MDKYAFINSKDISEHLRKIEYDFDSLETAWLIYQCRRLPYNHKRSYWNEVIETMPDCKVPETDGCCGWSSLHQLLKRYMDIIDREEREFTREDTEGGYVYRYSYMYSEDDEQIENFDTVFGSYSACMESLRRSVEELDECFSECDNAGLIKYRIKRQALGNVRQISLHEYNADGQLMDIIYNTGRNEEDSRVTDESFDCLWFPVPTPFAKGDLLRVRKECNWRGLDQGQTLVLDGLSTWNTGSRTDDDDYGMYGYGYFTLPDGTVYHGVTENYLDLEYYDGPYKPSEKILPVLSSYMKGEDRLESLLQAYRRTLLEADEDIDDE